MDYLRNNPTIIINVCEYIGFACDDLLIALGLDTEYEYLYIRYSESDVIDKHLVRYLKDVISTDNLLEYINLIDITFGYYFDKKLKPNIFPNSVRSITFNEYFNEKLEPGILPDGITSINFGSQFNQKLQLGTTLGKPELQQSRSCTFPNSIESITFGSYFNKELQPGIFPNSTKSITFGYWFNQELKQGVLPINIQTITFGWNFNKELNYECIPKSLKQIIVHTNYEYIDKLHKLAELLKFDVTVKYVHK